MKCYTDDEYSVLELFNIENTLMNYQYVCKWCLNK